MYQSTKMATFCMSTKSFYLICVITESITVSLSHKVTANANVTGYIYLKIFL